MFRLKSPSAAPGVESLNLYGAAPSGVRTRARPSPPPAPHTCAHPHGMRSRTRAARSCHLPRNKGHSSGVAGM